MFSRDVLILTVFLPQGTPASKVHYRVDQDLSPYSGSIFDVGTDTGRVFTKVNLNEQPTVVFRVSLSRQAVLLLLYTSLVLEFKSSSLFHIKVCFNSRLFVKKESRVENEMTWIHLIFGHTKLTSKSNLETFQTYRLLWAYFKMNYAFIWCWELKMTSSLLLQHVYKYIFYILTIYFCSLLIHVPS